MGDLWDRVKGPLQLAGAVGGTAMFVKAKEAFDGLYDFISWGGTPSPSVEGYGTTLARLIGAAIVAVAVFSLAWSFITYGLWLYFNRIPWPFVGKPVSHFYNVQGKWASFDGRKYKLKEGDRIVTKDIFCPPVTFRFSAKTDSTDLRFGYIEKNCILRWRDRPDELRIGGDEGDSPGPFDGYHKPGMGFIKPNTWVTVDVIVKPDSYTIRVDGGIRFHEEADLSEWREGILVRQGEHSTVWVRSLLVEQLPMPEPQYKPQFSPKDIVYAEYGTVEKGFGYWTSTGRSGEELADKLKELFKRRPPEQLTNGLLDVTDPISGPHKILRFRLKDGRCFYLNEYARITIDSCMSMPSFQPFTNKSGSSSSSSSSSQ